MAARRSRAAGGATARRGRAARPRGWPAVADSVGNMAIQTRPLGRTGADVTVLGYGAMELRGQPHGPAIGDDDAGRLLGEVLDGGINPIDWL